VTRIFTTEQAKPAESAAYWVDALCDAYVRLECDPLAGCMPGSFHGEIQQNSLSSVDVACVESSPQKVARTPQLIGRSCDDYFIVSMQRQGQCQVRQDRREAVLEAGDFVVYDSTRPYTLNYPDGIHQYTLKIPRSQLLTHLPNVESLTAAKVSGNRGAGRLMLNMVDTLVRDIDQLDSVSHGAVAESIVAILAASLRTLECGVAPALSSLSSYHLERIKQHVLANLCDPGLSAQSISAALRLSVSTLYRVFESQQVTLSDWIWKQRLERFRRDLENQLYANQTIIQIAFRWGFSDASHLSRSFKLAYGISPREFRTRSTTMKMVEREGIEPSTPAL
jgi:AraC-like DNA-binding protein